METKKEKNKRTREENAPTPRRGFLSCIK